MFIPKLWQSTKISLGLLMNHTSIVGTVALHLELARNISYLGLPYTLDETNAMALQGGDITYSLGNALWTVDFALWCISNVRLPSI